MVGDMDVAIGQWCDVEESEDGLRSLIEAGRREDVVRTDGRRCDVESGERTSATMQSCDRKPSDDSGNLSREAHGNGWKAEVEVYSCESHEAKEALKRVIRPGGKYFAIGSDSILEAIGEGACEMVVVTSDHGPQPRYDGMPMARIGIDSQKLAEVLEWHEPIECIAARDHKHACGIRKALRSSVRWSPEVGKVVDSSARWQPCVAVTGLSQSSDSEDDGEITSEEEQTSEGGMEAHEVIGDDMVAGAADGNLRQLAASSVESRRVEVGRIWSDMSVQRLVGCKADFDKLVKAWQEMSEIRRRQLEMSAAQSGGLALQRFVLIRHAANSPHGAGQGDAGRVDTAAREGMVGASDTCVSQLTQKLSKPPNAQWLLARQIRDVVMENDRSKGECFIWISTVCTWFERRYHQSIPSVAMMKTARFLARRPDVFMISKDGQMKLTSGARLGGPKGDAADAAQGITVTGEDVLEIGKRLMGRLPTVCRPEIIGSVIAKVLDRSDEMLKVILDDEAKMESVMKVAICWFAGLDGNEAPSLRNAALDTVERVDASVELADCGGDGASPALQSGDDQGRQEAVVSASSEHCDGGDIPAETGSPRAQLQEPSDHESTHVSGRPWPSFVEGVPTPVVEALRSAFAKSGLDFDWNAQVDVVHIEELLRNMESQASVEDTIEYLDPEGSKVFSPVDFVWWLSECHRDDGMNRSSPRPAMGAAGDAVAGGEDVRDYGVAAPRVRRHPKTGEEYTICEICRRPCLVIMRCPGCKIARCGAHRWTLEEARRHRCWLLPDGSLRPDIETMFANRARAMEREAVTAVVPRQDGLDGEAASSSGDRPNPGSAQEEPQPLIVGASQACDSMDGRGEVVAEKESQLLLVDEQQAADGESGHGKVATQEESRSTSGCEDDRMLIDAAHFSRWLSAFKDALERHEDDVYYGKLPIEYMDEILCQLGYDISAESVAKMVASMGDPHADSFGAHDFIQALGEHFEYLEVREAEARARGNSSREQTRAIRAETPIVSGSATSLKDGDGEVTPQNGGSLSSRMPPTVCREQRRHERQQQANCHQGQWTQVHGKTTNVSGKGTLRWCRKEPEQPAQAHEGPREGRGSRKSRRRTCWNCGRGQFSDRDACWYCESALE